MAAPAPQGGGGQSDNSNAVLWIVAALFAAGGIIWYVFKTQIVTLYLRIKLLEVNLLDWLATTFHFSSTYFDPVRDAILAGIANPSAPTFHDLVMVGTGVGNWLRFPFAAILVVMAFLLYFSNTTRTFRHTYKMTDLAKLEQNNWPQITPVAELDLIKQDIDVGPWAMALTPMQYCKRFRLLQEVRPHKREGVSRKEWSQVTAVLKRGEANKVLALQVGQLWKGTKALPPHVRALFAIFAARANADTDSAHKLLMQLAATSATKLNYDGVDALLEKHEKTPIVQEVITSHAYVLTVMATMLERARDDGVQASSDFLWLKPLDRRLWYMLNTVGRQTPFAEVAGPFAHWVAEKEAGRKLLVPMVEEATNALELMLKEVLYKPDDATHA